VVVARVQNLKVHLLEMLPVPVQVFMEQGGLVVVHNFPTDLAIHPEPVDAHRDDGVKHYAGPRNDVLATRIYFKWYQNTHRYSFWLVQAPTVSACSCFKTSYPP
jgi:hypothetical protein